MKIQKFRLGYVWLIILMVLGNLILLSSWAHAMEAPSDSGMDTAKAIHAIANEAGPGINMAEMRAIAWAIANRGYWRGIYGLRRPLEASEARQRACLRAWTEISDDNHGGDHWLSDYDLKHCKPKNTAFRFKMREVQYAGTTHFYGGLSR